MRKSCTQLDFVCLGGQYYGLGQSNVKRDLTLPALVHEISLSKMMYRFSTLVAPPLGLQQGWKSKQNKVLDTV